MRYIGFCWNIGLLIILQLPRAIAAQQTALVNVELANLRAAPNSEAAIVKALPRGTEVSVLNRQNGWARVRVGASDGYIRDRLLTASSRSSALPASTAPRTPVASSPNSEQTQTRAANRGNENQSTRNVRGSLTSIGPPSFAAGRVYLGVATGLTNDLQGGTGLGFVASFEKALLDSFIGRAALGVGAFGSYSSSDGPSNQGGGVVKVNSTASATMIGLQGNLHFRLSSTPRFDPYAGLVIGWLQYRVSASASFGGETASSSGDLSQVFAGVQFGGRYFWADRLSLTGRLGYPQVFALGVDMSF
jgi:hypothetical protein